MFKIAICDDDINYINFLKDEILSFTNTFEAEIHSYTSSDLFLKNLDENFDLVFLDYKIDHNNGVDLAIEIRKREMNTTVVFCTGEIDPAPVFFKLDTFRFLMKSLDKDSIHSEIEDIIKYIREKNKVKFLELFIGKKECMKFFL